MGENRPTGLCRRYGNLYSQTRVDAYDALDDLPEMAEFDDLKGKLLFSVVVVSVVESLLCPFPGIRFQTFQMNVAKPTGKSGTKIELSGGRQAYLNLVEPLFILQVLTASIQIQLILLNLK